MDSGEPADTQVELGLPNDRLGRWMSENVRGLGPLISSRKFSGGQSNPTFLLECQEGRAVLRRRPMGPLLPKAHMIEREFRIMSALRDSGVPVPTMLAYCDDERVIGSAFYLMEFVEGRIFWDPALGSLDKPDRTQLYDSMNRTVAELHSLDPSRLGLQSFGRPEGFMVRQVKLWSDQYRAAETHSIPSMNALMAWLPGHTPTDPHPARLFHGDLRMDNMIVHPTEPRIVAVLDWELSTLGDPAADFAYHMTTWRIPPDLFRGLAGRDLRALGIPTEAEYRAAYVARTGIDPGGSWSFYLAFALFRLGAILQGVAKRAQDGNASSADAAVLGAKAGPLADIGWQIVQEAA
jgi:aminoglycoside phosphotransferase (APT) family kinase protein